MSFSIEERVARAALVLACKWKPDSSLPWRKNLTPYRIFLAEFMLVRTRWDVVSRIFDDVIAKFPDLQSLASASEEEIAEVLAPLGLRKRVPYLKKAAVYLLEHHGGHIPDEVDALKKVPGIGEYTAAAVVAMAYGKPVVPADVNVFRFLSRLTGLPMGHPTKGSPKLKELLPLLSPSHGGPTAPVLLDFIRTICRPRNPLCKECPLYDICAFANSQQTGHNSPGDRLC